MWRAESSAGCADCRGSSCGFCASGCDPCYLDCCLFHEGPKQNSQQQQTGETDSGVKPDIQPYGKFEGTTGTTSGDLNPSGYVLIGEQQVPAKSQSGGFILDGTAVKIVNSDSYGLTVVELKTTC